MSERVDHRAEALRLMKKADQLREYAGDPNAASSAIRRGWRRRADYLTERARLHAMLHVKGDA